MSPLQRLLLALCVLAAAAAVAGTTLLGGGEPAPLPRAVDRPRPEEGAAEPREWGTDLAGEWEGGERVSAEGEPAGRLDLRVIGPDGGPVDAAVTLEGPGERVVELVGSRRFSEFPAGRWRLKAEHEDLVEAVHRFTVPEDELAEVTVQLLDVLTVRGRVLDRFGQPVGNVQVWFLRGPGTHPIDWKEAPLGRGAKTGPGGHFTQELSLAGRYRLTVGEPGEPRIAMSETVRLHSASSHQVTIVIGGTTRLEVEVAAPPRKSSEGQADLQLAVLVRNEDGGSGGEGRTDKRPRQGPAPDAPPGAPDRPKPLDPNTGARDVKRQEQGGADEPPARNVEGGWRVWKRVPVPANGEVVFSGLPPDEELRLELARPRDRLRSQVLTLAVDRVTQVRFPVPPPRDPAERKAEPIGSSNCYVQVSPPPAGGREVGITWE